MVDTTKNLTCPACRKPMSKVFISGTNVNLDICTDGCGGIFFDNRELEKFDEAHENIDEILDALKDKHFEQVSDKETRYCPCCHKMPMTKMGAANGKVTIDVCNNCGGKFLDYGELQIIRSSEVSTVEDPEFIKQLLKLEKEDMQSIEGFRKFVEKYRQIVPWHEN